MAIKQRKQLTGTTAQINAYAGVEGQLVWDKTKKKWVGMSGTAGTNYPMASESHTHSISNVTNLQSTLDGKQPKGDYVTSEALTDGLAGKANKAHTHAIADVTNLQTTLNTINGKIPKTGTRGRLQGHETTNTDIKMGTSIIVNADSPDAQYYNVNDLTKEEDNVIVKNGATGTTWTKVVYMVNGSVGLDTSWRWAGGKAPTLKYPGVLVVHWHNEGGIANYIAGVA